MAGYDTDFRIVLSRRQDFICNLTLAPGSPPISEVFPTGTTISLKFYADMDAVIAGDEIPGTSIAPVIWENGVLIRIESTIADLIDKGSQARLTVTYPSAFPNGDNLPWGKCKVERDD